MQPRLVNQYGYPIGATATTHDEDDEAYKHNNNEHMNSSCYYENCYADYCCY